GSIKLLGSGLHITCKLHGHQYVIFWKLCFYRSTYFVYLQNKMAYDMLHEISNQKDSWKVKVRIIRLWDAINLNNNELISLDMILLDEEVSMIHGKVMKHMVNKFRPLIQVGLVYMIANFKVTSAMNFRPVESEKVLNFLHTTKIQEIRGQKNIKIAEQSFTFCTV
uniref:Replication protein A 70 kDa DNA-binding subunit B/D first OB fold domain-containing protein n=1 Tax=Aegilops tauschii subsp. strangulata TaxID=200361 RepID=A0A453P2P4_AEGTS